jgi:hypothetical protein
MTEPTALLTEVLDHLLGQWPRLFPDERVPRRLHFVLQGTGVGKLIAFILANGERRPRCVVKIPRAQADNAELEHEFNIITTLRERGGAQAEATLPEPLDAPVIRGWQVVIERLLPGRSFSTEVPPGESFTLSQARSHLRRIGAWYVDLQRSLHPRPETLSSADVEALIEQPIRNAQRDADLRPHEQRYLDDLAHTARRLVGEHWRLGFVHGDLRPGNLLSHGPSLHVLDWQFGQLRGLPLLDWFEFAFRYYSEAGGLEEITGDHDRYRAAFADVFLGAHPYSALVHEETERVAATLGVAEQHLDLLLAMWLVDNTNKYLRFLGDRARRGYLFLMQNPPGGPHQSYRQQLRRQVYPCLLGQLAQSRLATAPAATLTDGLRQMRYPVG